MTILYDFELDDTRPQPDAQMQSLLREIKVFLWERFRLLADEIDSLLIEGDTAIVLLSLQEGELHFRFHNIDEGHSAKLVGTVTTDDLNHVVETFMSKKAND